MEGANEGPGHRYRTDQPRDREIQRRARLLEEMWTYRYGKLPSPLRHGWEE
jgi:hypothetical protein